MIISRNKVVLCNNCGNITPYNIKCSVPTIYNKPDFDYSGRGSIGFRCYYCNNYEYGAYALDAAYSDIAKSLRLFNITLNNAEILQPRSLEVKYNYIDGYKDNTYILFKNPFKGYYDRSSLISNDDISTFIKILKIFGRHNFTSLSANITNLYYHIDEYNFATSEFKKDISDALFIRIYYDNSKITNYLNSYIESPNNCTTADLDKACNKVISMIKYSIKKIVKDLNELYDEIKEGE